MKFMKEIPKKYYDLSIVDPPYGIGEDWKKRNGGGRFVDTTYKNSSIPPLAYFEELKRISKDYIIWGYNYFVEHLGPTNYLIVWDKMSSANDVFSYSKAEIACTSKRVPCNLVSISWDGYRMGKETGTKKIHPHQKPIELYKWLLNTYAKEGDRIFDSHVGSGSIRIACHDLGFDFEGCEIDEDYWRAQEERYTTHASQGDLFTPSEMQELVFTGSLFGGQE